MPKRRDIPDGRKYLDSLRERPCVVTGRVGNVEPAHLRLLGMGGTGIKPPDWCALSLHWELHRLQSQIGEGPAWKQWAVEHPDFLYRMLIEKAWADYEKWRASGKGLNP